MAIVGGKRREGVKSLWWLVRSDQGFLNKDCDSYYILWKNPEEFFFMEFLLMTVKFSYG